MVGRMDGTVIRLATPGDIDALQELERLFPTDRLSRRNMLRHIASPTAWLGVAALHEERLGYAMLLFRRDRSWVRLYSIIVGEAARGRGLAARLMDAAEAEAVRRDLFEMRLEVRADNPGAIRMYEGRGYVKSELLPAYYADGGDGFRLKRRLLPD